MSSGPVLIAGGYGLVGAQVAELLRERHPELPLGLGGRRPQAAAALAQRLGASAVALDVSRSDPLAGLEAPRAVIAAVNDPDDRLLLAAVRAGIPYVDITRWTTLVRRAALRATLAGPRAPVLLCSAWMAGVAPIVARACARGLEPPASIDISILYALKDRAGEDSVEYMDPWPSRSRPRSRGCRGRSSRSATCVACRSGARRATSTASTRPSRRPCR